MGQASHGAGLRETCGGAVSHFKTNVSRAKYATREAESAMTDNNPSIRSRITTGNLLAIVVIAMCLPASIVGISRIPLMDNVLRLFIGQTGLGRNFATASFYYAAFLGWIVCIVGTLLDLILIGRRDCGIPLKLVATTTLVLAIVATISTIFELRSGHG